MSGPRIIVRSGWLRSYNGPGALDVTRGSADGHGLAFAPSQELLDWGLAERARGQGLRTEAGRRERAAKRKGDDPPPVAAEMRAESWKIEDETWTLYERLFRAEMRVSFGLAPERFQDDEELALRRGVIPKREAWRALRAGQLGSRLSDGSILVVGLCYCPPIYRERGHCHARTLCQIWAALGAVDGGEVPFTPPCSR